MEGGQEVEKDITGLSGQDFGIDPVNIKNFLT